MFKNRALAALSCFFVLGVIAFALIPLTGNIYVCLASVTAASVFAALGFCLPSGKDKTKIRISACAFALAVFALGIFRISLSDTLSSGLKDFDNVEDEVTLETSSVYRRETYCYVDGEVTASEAGLKNGVSVRAYLFNTDGSGITAGDTVTVSVKYNADIDAGLRANGTGIEASGSLVSREKGGGLICDIKGSVSGRIEDYFGSGTVSAISKALLTGDKSGLDPYIYSVFSNSGISHLIAISGLHISIVSMIVFYLLCAIGVNSRISGVFGAVTALLYAAFVGFTPGAARAALMMAFLMGTRTFLRRSDSFTSLSLALLIILFINPYSLFSTGFQFTFICTAGLITVGPLVERLKLFVLKQSVGAGFFKRALLKAPCFFAVPLLLSFVAALFSFPVAFAHTDAFSVITPLTNLIAVPAFTLALQLLAVGVMLGYMIPGSGAVITVPAGWLIGRINGMAEYFYDSDVGFVTLHDALMLVPLFIVIAGTVCIIISRRNRLKAAAAVLVCFCVSFGACALAINARVSGETVIEYGKSKSEYIYVSDCGTNAYIDFGGRSANRTAVYENGSAHLDAFIIAKFDGYSAARFESLSGSMKVHKVYIPSDVNGNIYASEAIKRLANKRNCDIIIFNDKLLVENDGSEIYCDENGGYVAVTVDGRTVQFFNGVSDGYYNTGVSVICYKNALAPERVTGKDVYAISDSQDLFKDALIFDKYIRFVIKTGEGGYKVYEPRYS